MSNGRTRNHIYLSGPDQEAEDLRVGIKKLHEVRVREPTWSSLSFSPACRSRATSQFRPVGLLDLASCRTRLCERRCVAMGSSYASAMLKAVVFEGPKGDGRASALLFRLLHRRPALLGPLA